MHYQDPILDLCPRSLALTRLVIISLQVAATEHLTSIRIGTRVPVQCISAVQPSNSASHEANGRREPSQNMQLHRDFFR